MSSPILAFYNGTGRDQRGRSLEDIHRFSYGQLEEVHDFIQWLFPLPEPSEFNSRAPVLSGEEIDAFNSNESLRNALKKSLTVMLEFYGMALEGDAAQPRIRLSPTLVGHRDWPTLYNHNFLRITRILRSLTLLGLRPYSLALLDCLKRLYETYGSVIGPLTLSYWERAVDDR